MCACLPSENDGFNVMRLWSSSSLGVIGFHWDFIGISLGFHWLDLAPWACWEGVHFVRGRAGEVNGGPWRGEGEEAKKEDKEEEWKHAGWDHVE